MDRRQIIRFVGGTAAFAAATACPVGSAGAAKIARVGIIDDGSDWDVFRWELHELNYVEGQNIAFEYRRADGMPDRLAAAARELVQIPVDVIAVYGTPAAQAAQQATKIHSHRRYRGWRSRRRPAGRKFRATGRQYHRQHRARSGYRHQTVAGLARCHSHRLALGFALESKQCVKRRDFR